MTSALLHSIVSGRQDAPVLLLLNSLGATQAMWDPQMPFLESHYRVIRCDTRGHGQSPTPPLPYGFDDIVADVLAVLDAHEVETATVMGLSLGGMTALGLGLAAPERISQIICCAARADAPPPFVQNWHNRMAILDDKGIEGVWEATVGMWLSDETRSTRPEAEAALREGFLQTTAEGYRGCAHALMGLDYLRHLGEMRVPVLFVAGENDMAAPPDAMRAIAQTCPEAKYVEVKDAKHIINIDNPEGFMLAILSFLDLDA
ncbi:alpha/beta fold hydrolase [Celeribacter halophilus]|uniref:alpha/beta fold hydrolase n=1 Tax=Celeribacter halophilus TaxID=576117 RepID=UPI001C0A5740|nr:alpha/beta fold hydrolase [Celeribacter halophilus]MBU2888325.1 alpha/beta fold hydrolase [Celeribacter halophilus]MDO6511956.1 alpha/beta fold hydrolase [Celeribacter halophilus]